MRRKVFLVTASAAVHLSDGGAVCLLRQPEDPVRPHGVGEHPRDNRVHRGGPLAVPPNRGAPAAAGDGEMNGVNRLLLVQV